MKNKPLFPLLLTILITSCSNNVKVIQSKIFPFDTFVEIKLMEGTKENVSDIANIINYYDELSDNYQSKGINNIYSINQTNEQIEIDEALYKMLEKSFTMKEKGATMYNPLCGSLAKKWKDCFEKKEVLSTAIIQDELTKINNSKINFLENNKVQREGQAEIDLGGIAKGYTLDIVKAYLEEKELTRYIINAGSSSILLGEKNTKDGLFNVGLKDVDNAYLKLKNCFVSTSSISEQHVVIDGVTYSHIVNPQTGSAISENDAVIVISNNGAEGDALSTAMMMNSVDKIKELETIFEVKTIVVKNGKIVYQNSNLEVNYH